MIAIGLTPRQSDALEFIRAEAAAGRPAPSIAEIGTKLGLSSKAGVHRLLHGLRERGYVSWLPRKQRSLTLLPLDPGAVLLPTELRMRLAAHCAETGDDPHAVVVDALTLHFDALEGEVAP